MQNLLVLSGIIVLTIILYKYQLGAIGFFLLSIYFFTLAKRQNKRLESYREKIIRRKVK
ncbi:MAG: hypothetical protein ABF649_12510 [Bacillus sp. (in: firmicutes)]